MAGAPSKVVLVPPVLAFLPRYAGIEEPVAGLRETVLAAVGCLGRDVRVLGDPQARRVAAHLLASTDRSGEGSSFLVMGNGSARRTDASPGPFDQRAVPFDEALGRALRAGDTAAVGGVDLELARELWASVAGLVELAELVAGGQVGALGVAQVDYDDAPLGVQYWVMRWTCES